MTVRAIAFQGLIVSASAIALSATAARAQNTPVDGPQAEVNTAGLEEIVVTARKQEESLISVPVTAAAISAEDLTRNQINDVTAIVSQIAAIRFDQTYGGGGGTLTVRGIGSSTSDAGVDQTVATVFDGLQTSRGLFTKVGFLDLAQVEVLKGPQALFFGKNSPGGVLSLRSASPTEILEGYVRAGYTTGIGAKKIEGAISGPLGADFRARLAGSYEDTDGWIKNTQRDVANPFFFFNPFTGTPTPSFGAPPTLGAAPFKKNWNRDLLGRLTIDYSPPGDFSATLRLSGIRNRNAGVTSSGEIVSCGFDAAGNRIVTPDLLGFPDPNNDCLLNYRAAAAPVHPTIRGARGKDEVYRNSPKHVGELNAYTAALTMEYQAGPVALTSVSGYMHYDVLENHQSGGSFGYGANAVNSDWRQFSQELRAVTDYDGPINFAGGLYYDETVTTETGPNLIFPLPADPRSPSAGNPFFGSFFTYNFDGRTTSKSYSAFGQVRWKIVTDLEFDAGVRYSRDIRTGDVVNDYVNNSGLGQALLGFLEPEGSHVAGKQRYSNFSPELTLTYTVNPDTIVFGSYRTGYKPGQSANPYIVSRGLSPDRNSASPLFYATETVKGFELGFKSQMLNNTLRVTGAAFTYKYDDLQVSNFDSTKFVLTPLAGDLKTRGFELNANWRPTPPLRLNGSLGYTRARWSRFPGVACYSVGSAGLQPRPANGPTCVTRRDPMGAIVSQTQDLTGFQKFRSPDWSGNVGFVYESPVFSGFTFEINGNMSFVSSYNSQENNSPFAQQKGYQLYDAGIKLRTDDDHLEFSVIGKNLSDRKYVGATYDQANAAFSATVFGPVSRPRTFLFQVGYKY